jgi:hypothetical protein
MKKRKPSVWTWIGLGLFLAGLLPALWAVFVGPIYGYSAGRELDRLLEWPMAVGLGILLFGFLNRRNSDR